MDVLLELISENCDLVHSTPSLVLHLGNRRVAESGDALRALRVTHVVNVAAAQVGRGVTDGTVEYCVIDLNDHFDVVSGGSVCSISGVCLCLCLDLFWLLHYWLAERALARRR